jgi:hypothetical protein
MHHGTVHAFWSFLFERDSSIVDVIEQRNLGIVRSEFVPLGQLTVTMQRFAASREHGMLHLYFKNSWNR